MPSSVLNYYHTINFSIANYMEKEEDVAEYFSAASQISMKTKNRFSILLEHLMSVADLKNSVLAKAVVCAPSSRQLKKYRFFATQIMLGSIFMLP